MRRYSASYERTPMVPCFYQQESPYNYSLFSPYHQCQPDFTQSYSEFQNQAYNAGGPATSPGPPQGNRERILSCSDGKRKKGNLMDFAVKYKTEVRTGDNHREGRSARTGRSTGPASSATTAPSPTARTSFEKRCT